MIRERLHALMKTKLLQKMVLIDVIVFLLIYSCTIPVNSDGEGCKREESNKSDLHLRRSVRPSEDLLVGFTNGIIVISA